jgi:hypothetical protein
MSSKKKAYEVKKKKLSLLLNNNHMLYTYVDDVKCLYGITDEHKKDIMKKLSGLDQYKVNMVGLSKKIRQLIMTDKNAGSGDEKTVDLQNIDINDMFGQLNLSVITAQGILSIVNEKTSTKSGENSKNVETKNIYKEDEEFDLNEEEYINILNIPEDRHISMIGCNFGEIYPPNAFVKIKPRLLPRFTGDSVKDEIITQQIEYLTNIYPRPETFEYEEVSDKKKRGRKKKDRANKKTRRPQGSGKYMNSQMTIMVFIPFEDIDLTINADNYICNAMQRDYEHNHEHNHEQNTTKIQKQVNHQLIDGQERKQIEITNTKDADKNIGGVIYKVKIYRNGTISIPGIKKSDLSDAVPVINIVCNYLSYELCKNVKPLILKSVTRNYTTEIKYANIRINISEFEKCMMIEKALDNKKAHDDPTKMGIVYVGYNRERFFALFIKFERPDVLRDDKDTTIKVLESGKVNIDGANSDIDAKYLFALLLQMLDKYKDKIFYNTTTKKNNAESDDDSDDDDGNESIYDADEDE